MLQSFSMLKLTSLFILIPVFILGFFLLSQAQNPMKYTYLFRNVILSKSKNFELAPVLRGRVYYPRYFYIPALNQYMVYSDLDETGPFKIYEHTSKSEGKAYALLDDKGTNVITFETPLRFSYRSGCFYGPHTYIPFLETGKTDTLRYHQIHNEKLDLGSKAFEKLFMELYATSEYIEFINLRASRDDIHQAAVIFKRGGKVEILLSGLRDSRMICNYQEDRTINNFDDYYTPDIRNKENFPQSSAAIEMIPLVTENTNPFVYWRTGFNQTFHMKRYRKEYSSGWQGIMKVGVIPVYVPGESSGTVYINFKTNGELFKIKILDVEKADYIPAYHLGLRTFELPANIRTKNSLVFMESVQNSGDNRLGGGVFVVRTATTSNPSADIPSDMTEKEFSALPLTLQVALLDPEHTTSLKIYAENCNEWIPEIERLKNLEHLEMTTGMTEIPDAITTFTKLQSLSITYGNIHTVSPKIAELTALINIDLFSNKLTEFPHVFLEMEQLERLKIGANPIPSLPEDIDRLKNLTYLSLTLTNVTVLPKSMIGMEKLYIDNMGMENNVPDVYKQLFDYTKIKTFY
jgi:hypothetical protein